MPNELRPRVQRPAACLALVVAAACQAPPATQLTAGCESSSSAPRLVLLDSIILAESEGVFLGNPAVTFSVDESGRMFIPDLMHNRVVGFAPDGSIETVFGGPGAGPGEFRGISYAGLALPGTLWQNDHDMRRINMFDLAGVSLGALRYSGRLSSLTSDGATTWAGLADHGLGLAVARIPSLPAGMRSTAVATDTVHPMLVLLPAEYVDFPVLRSWDEVRLAAWADTLVVGFGGTDYLVRYDSDGTARDTIDIPACRRQGVPREVLDRWFRARPQTAEEQASFQDGQVRISGLLGMWRLSDGRLVIWNQDPKWDTDRILRGVGYISVVSPDLTRVCVDAELTAPGSGRVRMTVSGDKIYLLDQLVTGTAPNAAVTSVVRRFRIDSDACTWIATAGGSGPAR